MKGMYKELQSYIGSSENVEEQKSGFLYTIVRSKRNVPNFFLEYLLEEKPKGIEELASYAISLEDKTVFLRLLDFGFDINETTKGNSLLTRRVSSLKYYILVKYVEKIEEIKKDIEYLLKMGADPNVEGKQSKNTFTTIEEIKEKDIRIEVESFFFSLCEKYGIKEE